MFKGKPHLLAFTLSIFAWGCTRISYSFLIVKKSVRFSFLLVAGRCLFQASCLSLFYSKMAIVQDTWNEVLGLVDGADEEVQEKARTFLEGLRYRKPKEAMMADVEADFPKPSDWPGGPANAFIRKVMRHLTSLQAVAGEKAVAVEKVAICHPTTVKQAVWTEEQMM